MEQSHNYDQHVLIVDDHSEMLDSLCAMVKDEGYVCHCVASGADALALARVQSFAVAVLDVMMPEMDGVETAELLRTIPGNEDLPVILMTGAAHERVTECRGYDSGAVDFLYKPVSAIVLRAKVRFFCAMNAQRALLKKEIAEVEGMRRRLAKDLDGQDILFKHLNLGVVILDNHGAIVRVNPQCEALFGFDAGELHGRFMSVLFPDKNSYRTFNTEANACFACERGYMGERPLKRKHGDIIWTELFGAPIVIEGVVEGTVWAVADGTPHQSMRESIERYSSELKATNQHLEQMMGELKRKSEEAVAASKAKSSFIAGMSHEIRTPLHAVIGMSDILRDTNLDADQYECVNIIHKSGQTLLGIVNDILDFSKIEAGKLTLERIPFDPRTCIEDLYDIIGHQAAQKKLDFVVLIHHDVPERLMGDPIRLRQILLNLLSNAVKFTEAGEVAVRVRANKISPARCRLHIEVSDTGIGISKDKMHHVFAAFEQVDSSTSRRYGGTGLGLSIAKQLIEAMDGSISVDSVVGQGTRFDITLCLDAAPADRVAQHTIRSLDQTRVVVVDANPITLGALCEQLSSLRCEVVAAKSFEKANGVIAPGTHFDAIVVSVGETIENVERWIKAFRDRDHTAHIPCLLLCGAPVRGEASRMRAAGFDAYLTRPVRRAHLEGALLEITGRKRNPLAPKLITKHDVNEATPRRPVLLVEDIPVNQLVAGRMLAKLGYRYDIAQNGEEALAASTAKTYAALLLDCFLPDISGFDVAKRLRDGDGPNAKTPIIAMTAAADEETRQCCRQSGMNGYLSKPVTIEQLREMLEHCLYHAENQKPPDLKTLSVRTDSDTCPIDYTRLHDISNDDSEFEYALLSAFLDDADIRIAALRKAAESEDADGWQRAAHTLKGSGANVGALRFRDLSLQLERLDIVANAATISARIATLENELTRIRAHMASKRKA